MVAEESGKTMVAEMGSRRVETSGGDLVITRVFDAPRNLVFKAHTDPGLIAQWWGPRRFTTIVDRMDVGAGGA